MSATNAFEQAILEHIFQNANIPNIGDATGLRGSIVAGVFYISLHTADPGEGGNQTTSEAGYTSYARISVVRSAAGFTVVGSNVSNAGVLTFPTCTGGSSLVTHFGIGTDASGAGNLIVRGTLTLSLSISNGITPNFAVGELDVNVD
jgi:hypothetical protein